MTLDERVFTLINHGWTHPALDWWTALVRASDIWVVPGLALLGAVFWRGSRKARTAAVLALVVFAVGDGIIVRTTKAVVQRARPDEVITTRSVRLTPSRPRVLGVLKPLEIRERVAHPSPRGSRSFPSGHAWNAFAVATVIALCFRRWGWLAFLPALAIAYSRIYAGLHWPSDVVLSALLAVPGAFATAVLAEVAWMRLQPRLAERWRWARESPSLLPWREPAPA
jgi:undecaprenyl-diphosphatase